MRPTPATLRTAGVTVGAAALAYLHPVDPWDLSRKKSAADGGSASPLGPTLLPVEVQRALDDPLHGGRRGLGRVVFLSCPDRWLLRALREHVRSNQGLTTYRVSLGAERKAGPMEVEVDVLAQPKASDAAAGLLERWWPWYKGAKEVERVEGLSQIECKAAGVVEGEKEGEGGTARHVVVHLPPVDDVAGLRELVEWVEGSAGGFDSVTFTTTSPLLLRRLGRVLISGGQEGEEMGSGGQLALVDRPALLVHVGGANRELVERLAKAGERRPPVSSRPVSEPAVPAEEAGEGGGEEEEEQRQRRAEEAAEHAQLLEGLLVEGAFGGAHRLMEEAAKEEVAAPVKTLVQGERQRLARLLRLKGGEDEGGGRGVEGARVDPVSAWDALCAVQSEEVDVLTGMTLLPAGIAPLESVTAACLQESDVEALLDHGVIRLRGPEGSELPMVEPTTVEDLAAAAEEQEAGSDAEEAVAAEPVVTEAEALAAAEPRILCRVLELSSLRPYLSSSERLPLPWAMTGRELVVLPELVKRAYHDVATDVDIAPVLRARSDLRHADMQQATLNAEREALRHEWRALGDARAALQVRRSEISDADHITLQLELIRREQSAASRALEMKGRQARIRALRQVVSELPQAVEDEVLRQGAVIAESPMGEGVPVEEQVLWEMDHGHRGRPTELPQEQQDEAKPQRSSSWLGRLVGRGWWRTSRESKQ